MKTPSEFTLKQLAHSYDPTKAQKLKARKPAQGAPTPEQRKSLAHQISQLETGLSKLNVLIEKRERAEASENRLMKAKKERAAKEYVKPKTVSEKAKIDRENKRYREHHQQKTLSHAAQSSVKKDPSSEHSLSELKDLAIRVRGKIAVAKQKLAAL